MRRSKTTFCRVKAPQCKSLHPGPPAGPGLFEMSQIRIDNRLPAGLMPEMYIEQDEVLREVEPFGDMVEKFMKGLFATSRAQPLLSWIQWEGYWLDEPDELHQTLLVLGVLYFKGRFWPRALVCRHVPKSQLEATRTGMFAMIEEYLDKLRLEHEQKQNN
jgi:hypothetical protein